MSSEVEPTTGAVVQSLLRGLAVIEAFDKDHPSLTLSDVARRTNISRAAARRILLTLVKLGYAASDGKFFELRPKILNLGFSYLSSLGLWELAQPYMEELVEAVGESCSASVLEGIHVVYVARVPTKRRIMSINLNIGTRLPAHATSMGRVLLAGLDAETLESFLDSTSFAKFTDKTVTDPDDLRRIVKDVRRQRWAMVDQELEEGLRSVAVPLRDKNDRIFAAINISTHAQRMSMDDVVTHVLPKLQECGDLITRAIGRRGIAGLN